MEYTKETRNALWNAIPGVALDVKFSFNKL